VQVTRTARSRGATVVGILSLVAGLTLAAISAQQLASLAAFEIWLNGVTVARATVFALGLGSGMVLGSAMLAAAGVELLRGARRRRLYLALALVVTLSGWLAIPVAYPLARGILEEDTRDPVRFRHSLHFSGDIAGNLTNARFVQTIAGPERTCAVERGRYSLYQVRGSVGGHEATISISIVPYRGPGSYRARHEYGAGVSDPGEAGLNVEFSDASLFQTLYAVSGQITVDPGERSGTVDLIDEPLPTQTAGPRIRTRITGSWRCLLPGEQ
jgi:hypothetical protein